MRSFSHFYPTITPADVVAMADRSHFLAYLDNLVQSKPEENRYSFNDSMEKRKTLLYSKSWSIFSARLHFLQSLLEPESLREDWLELALTHDAPKHCDTLNPNGQPRLTMLYIYSCIY